MQRTPLLWHLVRGILWVLAVFGFWNAVWAVPQTEQLQRISIAESGAQGNNHSGYPDPSADGQWVAFWSRASNLVPGDGNGYADIFVRNHDSNITELVSVSSTGEQGNYPSGGYFRGFPVISGDGNFIAFQSDASNLVANDTNAATDIFLRNRTTGTTRRVSVSTNGIQGNHGSALPAISASGRHISFTSGATTLVLSDTNGVADVFVHDVNNGTTTRISVATDGTPSNQLSGASSISGDGRYVVFESEASNLVPNDTNNRADIFLHDRQTGETRRVTETETGESYPWRSVVPSIASNGQSIAYYSNSNVDCESEVQASHNRYWVCWRDLNTGDVETLFLDAAHTLTYSPNGTIAPAISADGRYVGFTRDVYHGESTFVWDRQLDQVVNIGWTVDGQPPNHQVHFPRFGHSDRYLAFHGLASNLVPGDTNGFSDGFRTDASIPKSPTATRTPNVSPTPTVTRTPTSIVPGFSTELVSIATDGTQGNSRSGVPAISGDGRRVAFESDAWTLAPYDTNVSTDIFIRDTTTQETISLAGLGQGDSPLHGDSERAMVSEDGNHVVFSTYGQVLSDTNDLLDVYYYNGLTGEYQLVSRGMDGMAAGLDDDYYDVDITPMGDVIAFATEAPLVLTDTNGVSDIFVYNTLLQTIKRSSLRWDGSQSWWASYSPSISSDGLYVVFVSDGQLDPFDSNGLPDIYYSDRHAASYRVSYSSLAPVPPYDSNGPSFAPRFAKGSSWIVFQSDASNLIAGDTNGVRDTYVAKINAPGSTVVERASVSSAGMEANGDSVIDPPAISADGRFVVFASNATNLAPGDTNDLTDLYLRDRQLGTTTRISYRPDGQPYPTHDSYAPDVSNDGRFIAYMIDEAFGGFAQSTMLYDRTLNQTTRLDVDPQGNEGNDSARYPSLSGDGSVATFISRADNFPGGSGLDYWQIYRREIPTNTLELLTTQFIPTTNDDSTAPSLSADGQIVVFTSKASNLLPVQDDDHDEDVYLYEPASGVLALVSADGNGNATGGSNADISGNAGYVAYERAGMIYRWERATNTTEVVSSGIGGAPGNMPSQGAAISHDGRYVAFTSEATNLVVADLNGVADIFVRDMMLNLTTRVSVATTGIEANGASFDAALSADGRFVAFASVATSLVGGDSADSADIFVHDRLTAVTTRITHRYDGSVLPPNMTTRHPVLSADGRYVVFESAERLVLEDSPVLPWTDIYVVDRQTYGVARLSIKHDGTGGDAPSTRAAVSADGLVVAYQSDAGNLVVEDLNEAGDVFRTVRPAGYPPGGASPTPIPPTTATPTATPTVTPISTHTATPTLGIPSATATGTVIPSGTPTVTATGTTPSFPTATATQTQTPPMTQPLYLPLLYR